MAGESFELSSISWTNGTSTPSTHQEILNVLHFHSPWILFLVFLVSFVAHSISVAEPSIESEEPVLLGPGGKPLPRSLKKAKEEAEKRKKLQEFSPGRKVLFLYYGSGLLATFVANGVNIVVHALTESEKGWWCGKEMVIYVLGSAFFYSIVLISLVDSTPSPNISHQITWILGFITDVILLGATIAVYTNPHMEVNSLATTAGDVHRSPTSWEIFEMCADAARVLVYFLAITSYVIFSLERAWKSSSSARTGVGDLDETAPLLVNGHANGSDRIRGNGAIQNDETTPSENAPISRAANGSANDAVPNGTANGHAGHRKSLDEDPAFYKPLSVPSRTWWEYLKGYSVFFPYLWPAKSRKLQGVVIICFLIVILQRLVNILVPYQMGIVVDRLGPKGNNGIMPWWPIAILVGIKFLQGSSGILGAVRSVLWIPISQYSYQALTTASFEHVHSLSLDFHLGKRTGEVLSALSKGNAINNFLEQVTFQVLPMVFDLGVAIIFFGIKLDAYYALVVAIVTFSYLYLTIRMARWRGDQRRKMTNLSREEDAVKNDSLASYETVKYFNAEEYEFDKYRNAVIAFQKMEYKVTISLNILNISQNMVFMAGLLATSFLSAYQVTTHQREVGDFVVLLTYMAQLQQPLNFFGSFYRSMQSAMISGERLLELFKEKPTVVDEPSAVPMPACEGEIRFQNVKFSYDKRKAALEGLSFTCRPGTTTAFVGESGGGKSTVFRLVFRFYNTQDGSIQVDGNDIRDITIDSLRSHIAVVPQDTMLFNDTVMYNLKYANQNATDEDVYAACRAASIHDKILAFTDGYNTKVGERGLRLSGGEKQRVAIARAIIKNPRIILLDEATAALDSSTEENIQKSLGTLSEGRTVLVIAHRLSTITNADQILVLHAGKIAEAGTHQELLDMKGKYASMWRKQVKANKAMEEAGRMVAKAKALEAVADRPGSSGNEGGPSEDVSENEADTPRLAGSKSTLQDSESVHDEASSITNVDEFNSKAADYGKSISDEPAKSIGDDSNRKPNDNVQ